VSGSQLKGTNMVSCHRPLILTSIVAVAASSVLVAGCGGSARVAPVASSTTAARPATTHNGLVAFSHCMRSDGVPNFPDPQRVSGQVVKLTIQRLVTSNPRYRAAARACNHLLPNGGQDSQDTAQEQRARLADELSFARCMRGHGVSRFPDPTAQGDLSVEMVQAQGINVHSPAVLRVVQTCLPASHGALTPSKVREALNHAGS
jgi:hypothetical protein